MASVAVTRLAECWLPKPRLFPDMARLTELSHFVAAARLDSRPMVDSSWFFFCNFFFRIL